jgi:hypothetical protein
VGIHRRRVLLSESLAHAISESELNAALAHVSGSSVGLRSRVRTAGTLGVRARPSPHDGLIARG